MFRSLLAVLLVLSGPAIAGPAEDAYLASRDKAITAINRKGIKPEQMTQRDTAALADLTKQLQAIIGPFAVKGFRPTGKSNLETLIKEVGFGRLDGLTYESIPEGGTFVVTTPDLFRRWLMGVSKSWAKVSDPAQLIAQALRSEDVQSRALISDAAVLSFGEIPLRKPESMPVALATMDALTQDDAAMLQPGAIIVAAQSGERIVIAELKPRGEAPDIAACTDVYKAQEAKANALFEKYRATGLKDQKLFDQYTKTQTEGSRAHRRCYGERLRATPYFTAATAQAQAFVDALAR